MKLYKAARTVLHVTALAWAIPFAQAAEFPQARVAPSQTIRTELARLNINRGFDKPLVKSGQKRGKA